MEKAVSNKFSAIVRTLFAVAFAGVVAFVALAISMADTSNASLGMAVFAITGPMPPHDGPALDVRLHASAIASKPRDADVRNEFGR